MKSAVVASCLVALLPSIATAVPLPADPGSHRPVVTVAAEDPTTIIRAVYDAYDAGQYDDLEKMAFTPELYKAYTQVQENAPEDDVPPIDFLVFLNAQDDDTVKIEDLAFTPSGPKDGKVVAKLTMFGATRTFIFAMKATKAGWRVDDIDWGEGQETLRAMIAAAAADQKAGH